MKFSQFWRLHFFVVKRDMENIDAKLDQMATYLAEIMLSQLGFRFIPKAKFIIGGLFTVIRGFPMEDIRDVPFFHTESLNIIYGDIHYDTIKWI